MHPECVSQSPKPYSLGTVTTQDRPARQTRTTKRKRKRTKKREATQRRVWPKEKMWWQASTAKTVRKKRRMKGKGGSCQRKKEAGKRTMRRTVKETVYT